MTEHTSCYIETVSRPKPNGIDIKSYGSVHDSRDNYALKLAISEIGGDASKQISMRQSRELARRFL